MRIAPQILREYPELNDSQIEIVGHIEGPLLVIAGPGSGKTYSIVLRALNLLLLEKALPRQLVLCTFTNKAAFEMRDRISAAARKVSYRADLSELTVSTIHSFCNKILLQHRHRTHLGNNYETLDELTQLLFLYDNFESIFGTEENGRYLGRWKTRWTAIEGAKGYFDKITEELVDPDQLVTSPDDSVQRIAKAFQKYEKALRESNRVDFAHLQKIVLGLLDDQPVQESLTSDIRFLLVDEYQDTNYIQEQLLLKLAEKTGNLCVVGDEDQSLYRFRGATVRNILEFPNRVKNCSSVKLSINYRSHEDIVNRYDRWMASIDWSNLDGPDFRYDKTIEPSPGTYPNYPAVFSIWGTNAKDEATRFADLVQFLKENEIVEDYSQIALLLHSVREDHSAPYLAALEAKGIRAFCPRARGYFELPVVRHLVASLAIILGWHGDARGSTLGSVSRLATYVDDAIVDLAKAFGSSSALSAAIQEIKDEIDELSEDESGRSRLADYFYRLLAVEPFNSATDDENLARNLAVFSQLINVFQLYYHYSAITHSSLQSLRFRFFNSFLRLLHDGGINEYEDPDQPFPKGYVQVMTIHQAKGLEFPVVVVGSLSNQLSTAKRIDRDLSPYYHRAPFEPESRITLFDRMRLHYVAFSRPEKVLVLTAHDQPKDHFRSIWQGLPQWPYVKKDVLTAQSFELKQRMPVKKTYSFTGDLRIYETCPRQYQFYRYYDFTPSRSAVIFFGLLVHQTIEEIHRIVIDGKLGTLNEKRIRELFERAFQFLAQSDVRPIGEAAKQAAFRQVVNYFFQNQEEMSRVIQTEVDVSVDKEGYILYGKVDLLLGGDGKLELLDFKTSPKPKDSPELLAEYERQLCTYAHILEQRYGKRADRLMLYWTAEEKKADALTVLPYDPQLVDEAGERFDKTIRKIEARNFSISDPPEKAICNECDMRSLCRGEGVI